VSLCLGGKDRDRESFAFFAFFKFRYSFHIPIAPLLDDSVFLLTKDSPDRENGARPSGVREGDPGGRAQIFLPLVPA
jgi:hypothetical protein